MHPSERRAGRTSRGEASGLRRGAFGVVLAIAVVGTAVAARAAPGTAAFRVEYGAGSLCAENDRFSAALLARTANARVARDGERASLFRIEVGGTTDHLVGRLMLVEPDGTETVREVPGATCDEVASALGVIAAVLVESAASPEPRAAPPPPPVQSSSAPFVWVAPRRPAPAFWRVGGGVGVDVESVVAPDPVAAVSVEGGVSLERWSVLSPELLLAVIRTFAERAVAPDGTARFEWTALRVGGCPLRWPESGEWALRPCALFDAGVLEARGEHTDRAATAAPTWFALGAALRGEADVLKPLWVSGEVGFTAPLRRDRFYFDPEGPSSTVFRVPAVGFVARLGTSVQFD